MSKNNIVLFEPEIPQNTGNIMRTCLKRAAVNYLPNVHFKVYENWEEFISQNNGKMYFFTRYGLHTPHELKLDNPNEKYYFIIGKESTGIPKEILKQHLDSCIRLPINDKIRSLNISNVAAIAIFEALRQQNYNDLSQFEPETLKGKDWLLK